MFGGLGFRVSGLGLGLKDSKVFGLGAHGLDLQGLGCKVLTDVNVS